MVDNLYSCICKLKNVNSEKKIYENYYSVEKYFFFPVYQLGIHTHYTSFKTEQVSYNFSLETFKYNWFHKKVLGVYTCSMETIYLSLVHTSS